MESNKIGCKLIYCTTKLLSRDFLKLHVYCGSKWVFLFGLMVFETQIKFLFIHYVKKKKIYDLSKIVCMMCLASLACIHIILKRSSTDTNLWLDFSFKTAKRNSSSLLSPISLTVPTASYFAVLHNTVSATRVMVATFLRN